MTVLLMSLLDTNYLLDTNVISELRKQNRADAGVQQFFDDAIDQSAKLYLSVITIGELRRGVDLIRLRGDRPQADLLEAWLQTILTNYADFILDFTTAEAQVWGALRVPQPQHALDKQIAATALTYDFTLVTRNVQDFSGTGVRLLNPFQNA
jgi:toxin FitB